MTESYLDQILEVKRLRAGESGRSLGDLEREAAAAGTPRDFFQEVRRSGMSVIAEIKRRSPSAGVIAEKVDAGGLAVEYERGGARCLSVLTDDHFFGGSLQDLVDARGAAKLPVLRKDFLLRPEEVIESRAYGADCVLLIVAALPDPVLLKEMAAAARDWRMAYLAEVHDEWELETAFETDPSLVGVNQRDLRTFEVDITLAARLRSKIPSEVAVVAESGLSKRAQIEELEKAGVDAVLIGETLMQSDDPATKLGELLGREELRPDGPS